MKMQKKWLAFLLAALMLTALLSGCGSSAPAATQVPAATEAPAAEPAEEPAAEPAASDTRVITDVFGRQVEIPNEVNSVAALGSAARLIVYAGGVDKITGCTEMELRGAPGMPFAYANKEHFAAC